MSYDDYDVITCKTGNLNPFELFLSFKSAIERTFSFV